MKRTPPRGLTTRDVTAQFNDLADYLIGNACLIKCSPSQYRRGLRIVIDKLWNEIDGNMSKNAGV